MNLRRVRFMVRMAFKRYGLIGGARWIIKTTLYDLRQGGPDPWWGDHKPKPSTPVHPFDEQFGVETGGIVFPEDLACVGDNDVYGGGYLGVPPSLFHQIFGRLDIGQGKFTFVDLGSGKGRAVLLASEYPFQRVIGVELSPRLHKIACENLRRYHSPTQCCKSVSCVQEDAARFPFPLEPLIIYMWHPFHALVLKKMLANLQQSLRRTPREIYVLCFGNEFDQRPFADVAKLRKLWSDEFAVSAEDYDALPVSQRSETCSVYVNAAHR